jgi:probable rRNA maturation factor
VKSSTYKKTEIVDDQSIKQIPLYQVQRKIRRILNVLKLPQAYVSVLLCDDSGIKKINKKVFGRSYVTDVISLPWQDKCNPDYLGDIIISVERAVKSAVKYDNTWHKEFLIYLIHGILHLTGYDDVDSPSCKKMEAKQNEVLAVLSSCI